MKTMASFLVVICLLGLISKGQTGILEVKQGVYSKITAQISEDVPKQFCDKIIENLQVSN